MNRAEKPQPLAAWAGILAGGSEGRALKITLHAYEILRHPANLILVEEKKDISIHAYNFLKWEYTWRNDRFFKRAFSMYCRLISLAKKGLLYFESDFFHIICPNRLLRFKSIPALQHMTLDIDAFENLLKNKSAKSKAIKSVFSREDMLEVAFIRKESMSLFKEYGYNGIFLNIDTTPVDINVYIDLIKDNLVPEKISLYGPAAPNIDTHAITIYDQKKWDLGEYEYDGDVLLSIDMSKSDDTIIDNIKMLLYYLRGGQAKAIYYRRAPQGNCLQNKNKAHSRYFEIPHVRTLAIRLQRNSWCWRPKRHCRIARNWNN